MAEVFDRRARGGIAGTTGAATEWRRRRSSLALALVLGVAGSGCSSVAAPNQSAPDRNPSAAEFLVAVGAETFVMRTTDPQTIQLARARLRGEQHALPVGARPRSGDGGFNAPWSWHLDPAETRMVEVAIEVCDGTPSYVEAHLADFPRYCPWGARVTAER